MNPEDAIPLLKAVVARERIAGCPMASENLIEPALRRWKSYGRRFKRHKDKSLEHRAHDLEKGLIATYPDYAYVPGCVRHLAQSFAEILFQAPGSHSGTSAHAKGA